MQYSPAPRAFGVVERRTALMQACLPARLAPAPATVLARAATVREYEAGEVVWREGASARSAWLVVAGTVAVGAARDRVTAGRWLDLHSALLRSKHAEDAVSLGDCTLLELPRPSADAEGARVQAALLALLAAELLRLREARHSQATQAVPARVAAWLLRNGPAAGRQGEFRLPQRKRDIADQLGTTAESFSRALAQLRGAGLIAMRGATITLLDKAGLRRLAGAA